MPSAAGLLLVGASGVFCAASAAAAKLAMNLGAPPCQVAFVRGCVMFSVMFSVMLGMRASGVHPHPVRHWLGASSYQRRWLLLRTVVSVVTVGLSTASLRCL